MIEKWAEGLTVPPWRPRDVRLDPEKLYVALDRRRRELRISARELLRQVGEHTPSSLTRLGQGRMPSADLLARFLVWLGDTDLGPYLSATEPEAGDAHHPETGPAGLDVQQLRAGENGDEA